MTAKLSTFSTSQKYYKRICEITFIYHEVNALLLTISNAPEQKGKEQCYVTRYAKINGNNLLTYLLRLKPIFILTAYFCLQSFYITHYIITTTSTTIHYLSVLCNWPIFSQLLYTLSQVHKGELSYSITISSNGNSINAPKTDWYNNAALTSSDGMLEVLSAMPLLASSTADVEQECRSISQEPKFTLSGILNGVSGFTQTASPTEGA